MIRLLGLEFNFLRTTSKPSLRRGTAAVESAAGIVKPAKPGHDNWARTNDKIFLNISALWAIGASSRTFDGVSRRTVPIKRALEQVGMNREVLGLPQGDTDRKTREYPGNRMPRESVKAKVDVCGA